MQDIKLTPEQADHLENRLYKIKSQPQILIDTRNKEYTYLWTESAEIGGAIETVLCSFTWSYAGVGNLWMLLYHCENAKYKIIK